MRSIITYGLIFIFLSLGACKTSKEAVGDLKRKPPRFLIDQLDHQQREFAWFSGKGKLKFTQEGKTQSAVMNIRMRKDSIIWLTISKVGFEAARMQVTPDSVHLLLRKEKEYYARGFSFFLEEYNLDLDFNTLQQIILGNALLNNLKKPESRLDPPYHLLSAKDGPYLREYRLGSVNYLLAQMKVVDPANHRAFTVDYEDYKLVNAETTFAYDRITSVEGRPEEQAELALRFSKVELDVPKSIPFSVSDRYVRK